MSGVTRLNRRSARKPKGEGHSRRAEILSAAEQIFVEHGYEGATIRKARMRRMMEAYVAFGFANPNAYRLVYLTRPLEARDGAETVAQQLGAALFRSFEAVVEDAGKSGRLRGDARATTQALWAGGHGVVSLMITKPYFDWVDRETLVKTLMDALFMGLLKP